jgi:REP element-mobilizing transposase RayT
MADFHGFLITWTTYGTWLPGDERGHVSDVVSQVGVRTPGETTPGTPFMEADVATRERAVKLLQNPPVYLDKAMAHAIAVNLVDAARKRGWRILRAALMRNHVHVVVTDCPDDGPAVRRVLKGTSQAELTKHAGKAQKWFTEGGSDRYKHSHREMEAAVDYVANQLGKLVEIIDMEVFIL